MSVVDEPFSHSWLNLIIRKISRLGDSLHSKHLPVVDRTAVPSMRICAGHSGLAEGYPEGGQRQGSASSLRVGGGEAASQTSCN